MRCQCLDNNEEIKNILKEILKWTKFQGMQKIKQVLETALNTDTKKLVYELSDGISSPKIAKIAGADSSTVRDYWRDWAILGIVEIHPEYKRRYRRIFSLKEVGIEVPEVKEKTEVQEEKTEGEENEQR